MLPTKKLISNENKACICPPGVEFCKYGGQLRFRVGLRHSRFWKMKPLAVLFQVLEIFPQKFLRKLLIIFICEGCAYFSFKEISNLFQTGNCLGDAIRLFRTLMQLDSNGRCLRTSQVHMPLPWELSLFPSPPGWTLWSRFCFHMLL